MSTPIDAVLIYSFGGPESPEEVMPFLRHVTQGKGVPDARLNQVAETYLAYGGISPLPGQVRNFADLVRNELANQSRSIPVYVAMRHTAPFVGDTVAEMTANGHRRVGVFVTSAFSSYSGCRAYREELDLAVENSGGSLEVNYVRRFFNHPGFIEPFADRLKVAMRGSDSETKVLFSAHSIPLEMSDNCDYLMQLNEAAMLVATKADLHTEYELVFQSRSGRPDDLWLEPDVAERIVQLATTGTRQVVVVPIGFVSDHHEVRYDLDNLAAKAAAENGMQFARVETPFNDRRFVQMAVELLGELEDTHKVPQALGDLGPRPQCSPTCCLTKTS